MRETVLSRKFETQTADGETATARGTLPTRTELTRPVRVSIRKMRFPFCVPTQTAPPP